jgi:hypothetical protein
MLCYKSRQYEQMADRSTHSRSTLATSGRTYSYAFSYRAWRFS